MTYGSLFSGCGGLDLGLTRAGMECRFQVEIDPSCRRVLAKHWPDVPRWDDVKTFPPVPLEDWSVDLICGGFPCQDISIAKHRAAGLDGERSGLWSEFVRIIRGLRPGYVLVENSPAMLARGMGRVLGDLAALGYDAEWACLPAAAFGAPHIRDRLFLLAYPVREQPEPAGAGGDVARPAGPHEGEAHQRQRLRDAAVDRGQALPVAGRPRLAARIGQPELADFARTVGRAHWGAEPRVGRVADGVPAGLDRLRALGNAVVPQIAEWLGRCILAADPGPMTREPS
jgi:DNA (cytosine-5)-methyltransferase 1